MTGQMKDPDLQRKQLFCSKTEAIFSQHGSIFVTYSKAASIFFFCKGGAAKNEGWTLLITDWCHRLYCQTFFYMHVQGELWEASTMWRNPEKLAVCCKTEINKYWWLEKSVSESSIRWWTKCEQSRLLNVIVMLNHRQKVWLWVKSVYWLIYIYI